LLDIEPILLNEKQNIDCLIKIVI